MPIARIGIDDLDAMTVCSCSTWWSSDEAHRTASVSSVGEKGSAFGLVHDNDVVSAAKCPYMTAQLMVGDSLRRSIDRGLAGSRLGVITLSPDFFRNEWPQPSSTDWWRSSAPWVEGDPPDLAPPHEGRCSGCESVACGPEIAAVAEAS